MNQTVRYRLLGEVRSAKVMPTRKAPTMEELAMATQRKLCSSLLVNAI
jgi:hypothetical protein